MTERKRIGVDLGGTKIEVAVLVGDSEIVWRKRAPTPYEDYQATLHAIRALVERAIAENHLSQDTPVGIGTPGSQSPRTGLMRGCNSTVLNEKPLLHDLRETLARPIRLANDADCFALSEACAGVGRGADSVFGVILGTGVGGGVVIRQQLLSGPNNNAGEWGHNSMPGNSVEGRAARHCFCGRENCIENWLSGRSLGRSFREAGLAIEKTQQGIELMRQGHPDAVRVWRDYVQLLARALAVVINIVDPDVVVLGGGVSNVNELYRDIPELWEQWVFSDVVRTKLLKAEHGDSSGVIGAAWLWP